MVLLADHKEELTPVAKLTGVCKFYGHGSLIVKALDQLNLEVNKGDFLGKDNLLKSKNNNNQRRLIGFEMNEKAIPRKGYNVYIEKSGRFYIKGNINSFITIIPNMIVIKLLTIIFLVLFIFSVNYLKNIY